MEEQKKVKELVDEIYRIIIDTEHIDRDTEKMLRDEALTKLLQSKLSEAEKGENVAEFINHYFPNSKVVEMLIPEKYKEEVEQFLRNKSVWQVEEDNPNKE